MIFITYIKIHELISSDGEQTENQENLENHTQSMADSGVPYRLFNFDLPQKSKYTSRHVNELKCVTLSLTGYKKKDSAFFKRVAFFSITNFVAS